MDPSTPPDHISSHDATRLDAPSSLYQLLSWAFGPPADVAGICTLRDGARVEIRPICGEDMQRVRAFHQRLSPQTIYLRFGHLLGDFPDELVGWLVRVDGDQRMAFVATDATDDAPRDEIIAIARYCQLRPQVAEMAVVVADLWQGRGIGLVVVHRLAIYGHSRGYTTFVAPMSRWNTPAIHALYRCELPYTIKRLDEDTLLASVDLTRLDQLHNQQRSEPVTGL